MQIKLWEKRNGINVVLMATSLRSHWEIGEHHWEHQNPNSPHVYMLDDTTHYLVK
jgi:hypothetical protein